MIALESLPRRREGIPDPGIPEVGEPGRGTVSAQAERDQVAGVEGAGREDRINTPLPQQPPSLE